MVFLKRYRSVLFTILAVLVADQLSKELVLSQLRKGESVEVIPSLFNLVLVFNPGAAFGMFSGLSDGVRHLFLGTAACGALLLLWLLLVREYSEDLWGKIAIGGIIGGAVGNLIDRARFGEVVDFLDFYIGSAHWPAFNIADSAICVGVGVLLLFGKKATDVRADRKEKKV